MDVIGMFVSGLAGGLVAAALCEWASAWWRARTEWPKRIKLRGALITVSADGLVVYRRQDGSCWAERLRMADEHYRHIARAEPLDQRRELH